MKKIISIGGVLVLIILLALSINFFRPKVIIFNQIPPNEEKTIYLEKPCDVTRCDENSFKAFENKGSNVMIATVFGTLYEDTDNVTIFGTCSDSENKPKDTNATLTIFYQNTSVFVNQTNMSIMGTGKFNYSTTLNARGNYLVQLNCTAGNDYAIAYTEFQNPNWINKIQNALSTIKDIAEVKDFEIDKLTVVSPIYPNESIIIEATFSDENGTLITPTSINLTVLYPNRTTFLDKNKNDFDVIDNVWNYSQSLTSSPTTGTYYVHLLANYSAKQSLKTTQFRVATGGPFSLRLDCPSTVQRGDELVCTVQIIDEGEVEVESITTVWVDSNADGELDNAEPQVSFSKETVPQQVVQQLASITVPLSHDLGVYIVRSRTKYINSQQPDSTASDTITIIVETPPAKEPAGGTGTTPTRCDSYANRFGKCYYFDTEKADCVEGCPEGFECKDLRCMSEEVELIAVKELSIWGKFKEDIGGIRQEITTMGIINTMKLHIGLILILIGIILLIIMCVQPAFIAGTAKFISLLMTSNILALLVFIVLVAILIIWLKALLNI